MTSFYEEIRKSDTVSDEQENAQSRASIDKWIFRLLLFLMGFMPLVVMANVEEVISPLISNVDVLSSGVKGDLFTHYKALLVLIITIITGVMLLVKVFFMGGTIKKTWLNYVLGAFVVAIVVSTVMSPNISIALNGQHNRSDGAISWLCYVALMFIAMNIEYPKKVVTYIMYTMMPFVIINLYIITMNFYGKDLLQNNTWLQNFVSMMLPEGSAISEGSQLVGTLNQWNYMSGMFGIMTVMFLSATVLEKTLKRSILFLMFSLISMAIVLMSLSTSGFLTVLIFVPIILFYIFKSKKVKQKIILILIFIVAIIPIFDTLAERIPKVWYESIGIIFKHNPYDVYIEPESPTSKNSPFNIELNNKVYASNASFELPILSKDRNSAGSGRIYIWGETVNLIKDKLFFGYGLDSLIYNFEHYALDAQKDSSSGNHVIVDKPHNMYIGILYGTGIIAFISILLLVYGCTRYFSKRIFNNNISISHALMLGWFAYLFQALFNDGLPSISTVAWIIAGIYLGIMFSNEEGELE